MQHRPLIDWRQPSSRMDRGHDIDAAPGQRLSSLAVCLTVPLVLIGLRLAQLQTWQQQAYLAPFFQTRTTTEELPARQGRILAADGSILADDMVSYDILVHYRWLEEPVDRAWLRGKVWERLGRRERRQSTMVAEAERQVRHQREQMWLEVSHLSGRPLSELRAAAREIQVRVERIWQSVNARQQSLQEAEPVAILEPSWVTNWWHAWRRELFSPPARSEATTITVREQEDYHVLLSGVSEDVAQEVAAHPEQFPGVKTAIRTRRVYPYRDVAPHLLGARTPLREDEPKPDGLHSGDTLGRSGIERQYQATLQGQAGELRRVVNRHGEVLSTVVIREPQHGRDVVLTIDLPLQQRAEQLLDASLRQLPTPGDDQSPEATTTQPPVGGCLVAVDVHTGAVLTAACAPRFDANCLVSVNETQWAALTGDARKPLFPRVTQMALPPGSVFKAVTAVAMLEAGVMQADETTPCIGYLDQPEQHRCLIFRHYGIGHGDVALADALARSCNVYFFRGARRLGPDLLVDWSQRFGIGAPTGLDLPGEAAGSLPRPGQGPRRWYTGDTLGLAIGQSSLTATPLQIARMMAAIANGGALVTPHFVAAGGPTLVEAAPGSLVRPVFAHPDPQPIAGLHPETLAVVQEGLHRVVHDPHGTGYKSVRLDEVAIAGKTGTAESGGGRPDHAWFAGYVPADQPRVALVVVLEHGGSGGKTAGPIARDYVRSLLQTGLITSHRAVAVD